MDRIFRTFMERVTTFPDNPTVRVFINGLGLLCFSEANNQAEIGFLETESRHPLLFTIYNRHCTPIYTSPPLPRETKITINSNNPGLGQLYTPDMGEVPDDSDDEDFRHLLNLDELHERVFQRRNIQIKRNSTYLAKLFLSNGIFFNAKRSRNRGKIRSRKGVEELPRIGKVIGAHISGTQISVRVNSQDIPLTRDANSPYTIVIRYKCADRENSETDFQRFHSVLDSPQGDELDLFYDEIEPGDRVGCESNFEKSFNKKRLSEEAYKNPVLRELIQNIFDAEEACQGATKPECPNNLMGIPEGCP